MPAVLANTLGPLGSATYRETGDPDVAAFVAAAGITDQTQLDALEVLVFDLKEAGVWTKLRALWPFVGGTAAKHKWNLKDPRDADDAFRLTFHGTWNHSSTGAKPNGSNGYADTKFNPFTDGFSSTNGSMGVYSRTNTNGGMPYDMGASNAVDLQATLLICRYNNNNAYFCFGTSTYAHNASSSDGRGFFVATRDGSISRGFKNGSQLGGGSSDACSLVSQKLYLGSVNRAGNATYFSDKEQALTFVGDTLTGAEISDFYAAAQDFQTTLGRAV